MHERQQVSAAAPPSCIRWYLVQSQVGREIQAHTNLNRQGYKTFLPVTLRTVRHARQLRTTESAYFPGYIFVSLDVEQQAWRPINGTLGVVRLFAIGARPIPVPVGVVEGLQAIVGPDGFLDSRVTLAAGDPIRLTAGPFADRMGFVQSLSSGERVRVLLAIMNGEVVVEVGQEICEPVADCD